MSIHDETDKPTAREPAKNTVVETASFRVYRVSPGRYKAYGSVEKSDTDITKTRPPVVEGGEQDTAAAALAEVLSLSGFVG